MRAYRVVTMVTLAVAGMTGAGAAQDVGAEAAVAVAERFTGLLRGGDFAGAEAMVQPGIRAQLGAARLEAVWAQVRSAVGDLKSVRRRSVTPQDTLRVVELFGEFNVPLLLRVVVSPQDEVVGFWIGPAPPEEGERAEVSEPPYAERERFREEDVRLGTDPWELPGTLAIPVGDGRYPAVVLVHGSGPHDRDETVGGVKVFRDLAWGLASRGIAVLRYEKRTRVHGARMGSGVTVETETIEDALAALNMLRSHPAIDYERVYLLGHSLGGQVGPEIALRDGHIAGVILMAAPARPLDELLRSQLEYLRDLPANSAPEAQARFAEVLGDVERLSSGAAADSDLVLGAPVSYFRDLMRRDPVEVAGRLATPLLVLQGERDYQVTMADFEIWREATKGRPATTLRSFPSLNHVFVPGSGPSTPAEYERPGFVSAEVVETIARWLDGGAGRGTSSP
jgi:uncharacterized protein